MVDYKKLGKNNICRWVILFFMFFVDDSNLLCVLSFLVLLNKVSTQQDGIDVPGHFWLSKTGYFS
jgi:hypothetical protein